jgi:hypothetical protein
VIRIELSGGRHSVNAGGNVSFLSASVLLLNGFCVICKTALNTQGEQAVCAAPWS